MKEIHIVRDNREYVFTIKPVLEFKLDRVVQGLESRTITEAFPAHYTSEATILRYLDECGENYRVVEDDKEVEVFKAVEDVQTPSAYSRVFDYASSPSWNENPEFNRAFLMEQENFQNHKLRANGHVLLNDVYDALGFTRTSVGAIVGWLFNGDGDGYIDFGIHQNTDKKNPVFRLDFNVDGVIYDKI